MSKFLEATLDPNLPNPNRFSIRYHAGAGGGIDKSVSPVQLWLPEHVRRARLDELRECLVP